MAKSKTSVYLHNNKVCLFDEVTETIIEYEPRQALHLAGMLIRGVKHYINEVKLKRKMQKKNNG